MGQVGKLTAAEVAKLTKPGRYADGGGLYLQISKWGTKAWIFRYMIEGRARTMGLGDCSTFLLKEARERARAQRQLLADGVDPLNERKKRKDAARIEAAKAITFEDAAARYMKAHRPSWKNEKHIYQWEATLSSYAYPVFGKLPAGAVDTGLVMKALEPIWQEKTETAIRLRGRIEAILAWATVRGYRTGDNPARWRNHLDKLLPAPGKIAKVTHQPSLPYADLPEFMADLRGNKSISARALEFTILCATRTSETIFARWDEIDRTEKVWSIPGERTKSGREHRIPVSEGALAALDALPRDGSGFIFPGGRAGKPLSNMAMLEMVRGLRPGLTTHGFRSSFRSWAAEQTNFPREIAEAALAHVLKDKTERSYQRGDLLEKRRKLMQAWDCFARKGAK
jgi:integrase